MPIGLVAAGATPSYATILLAGVAVLTLDLPIGLGVRFLIGGLRVAEGMSAFRLSQGVHDRLLTSLNLM